MAWTPESSIEYQTHHTLLGKHIPCRNEFRYDDGGGAIFDERLGFAACLPQVYHELSYVC